MTNQTHFVKRITALAMALTFLVASSATSAKAALTPDLTSQQIETVLEQVFAALVAFDVQTVVDKFRRGRSG